MTGKMIGSLESYLTCVLLLMTTFTLTLSQSRKCRLNAPPHPQGICGRELDTARANLCFLLRRAFPDYFPTEKRSMADPYKTATGALESMPGHPRARRDLSDLERIYSIPVSVLARIHLTNDNWRSFVYKRGDSSEYPREVTDEFKYTAEDLEELPLLKGSPTKMLIRMLSKRSNSIQKRSSGLACDCCINACTARHLATYC